VSAGRPRDGFPTERANPASAGLERLPTPDAFDVFQLEDERMLAAVAAERASICAAIDLVAERLGRGGRLFYVGAGTSGRLGVLDASECPPTFLAPPELVQGVIAGGPAALTSAVEGAEDDGPAAARDLDARGLAPGDVVFGISAGGTTAYVHAALEHARARGAATIFLASVPRSLAPDRADVSIRLDTGPEVLAGSTRLKAGSATKLVLNRVSTLAMARLGKVHGNLMVDVDTAGNAKLKERGVALVVKLTGLDRAAAAELLAAAGGRVKTAAVMHARAATRAEAERLLAAAKGRLSDALAS
jgi:N-acetylmuramic acid 6-phosphate etherase